MKWYNVQIYDKKDYSKYWYPIRAVSHTHATYKMCDYLTRHTDMTFEDFDIVQVKEMWWKK